MTAVYIAMADDARGLRVFADRLRQDVHYGWRLFRRAPAVNLAVVLALALGIGATAATFSVVDGVLLRPLDYADADELVVVMHRRVDPVAPANFYDWQRGASEFAAMGAAEYWTPTIGGGADPEKLFALHVSDELLPMLGVPPARGRLPRPGEDGTHEVVIADALWRRAFGADPAILTRRLTLDGVSYAVVGVMPPHFQFAPFWATRAELWAPLRLGARASSRSGQSLRVFARLAPGVGIAQARAAVAALTTQLEARYPGTNRDVVVTPLKEIVVGDARASIVLLFAAVGLVLLVTCANVAHLLLARAASRGREVIVRAALGAGWRRLMRQVFTESLVLAGAGGLGGVLVAHGLIATFKRLGAESLPRVQSIQLDGRVLAFGAAVAILTAIAFGLAPALKLSRPDLTGALRDADRGSTSGRRSRRIRQILIGSEVALALTLLAGAGLLIRSFVSLRTIDPGFAPDRLVSFVVPVVGVPEAAPDRRLAFYDTLVDRFGRLPGVESVGAINHVPLVGDLWGFPFLAEGHPEPAAGSTPAAAYRVVLPGYFATMGVRLAAGRDFTREDRSNAPAVAIVSAHLARAYFPSGDAIGRRIRVGSEWRTVVGVVPHVVRSDWQDAPGHEVYLPLPQVPRMRDAQTPASGYLSFVVRATDDPAALVGSIRGVVRAMAPSAPVADVFLMREVAERATQGTRFVLLVLGVFAGAAWVLATIGICGVMSHDVALRRREIGIRIALGASRAHVAGRVLGEGLTVIALGLVAGLAGAVGLGRTITAMLVGVTPSDPTALAGAVAALIVTATVACYIPARMAATVDPQHEISR